MTITVALREVAAMGVPPKGGDPVARVTPSTIAEARLLTIGLTDDAEREFLRQVRADDVASIYVDRDQNWADVRIRGVPASIADDATSVSLWIAPLERGASLDIPAGACKLGFSRARTPVIDDSDIAAAGT